MSDTKYSEFKGFAADDHAYQAVSADFYSSNVKTLGAGQTREISFTCSVLPEQGILLYDLVRQVRPTNSLEIGLAWGGSAIHILAALTANGTGHHVAVDPMQEAGWSNIGVSEAVRLGYAERFQLLPERSDVVLPRFVEEGRRFQFIFIDGDHRYDAAFVDFYFSQRLLDVGGVLMFDDACGHEVEHVLKFIESNMPNLRRMDVPVMGRFAVYQKMSEDERTIGFAKPF